MRKWMFSCVLFFNCLAFDAHAQTYPEYVGVYVFDEISNEWTKLEVGVLQSYQIALSSNVAMERRRDGNIGWYRNFGQTRTDYENSPIVNVPTKMRILIRSRMPGLKSVSFLVSLEELLSTIPPGEPLSNSGERPGTVESSINLEIVAYGASLPSTEFNIKIVDELTSEYIFDMDTEIDNFVPGFGTCMGCDVEIRGFVIKTQEEFDHPAGASTGFVFAPHLAGFE